MIQPLKNVDQNLCIVYDATMAIISSAPSVDLCFLDSLLNTNNVHGSKSYQLPGVKMTQGRERNKSREPKLYNANLLLQIKLLFLV